MSPIVDLEDIVAQQIEIGVAEKVDGGEGGMRASMWRQDCGSVPFALRIEQQHSVESLLCRPHRRRHLPNEIFFSISHRRAV